MMSMITWIGPRPSARNCGLGRAGWTAASTGPTAPSIETGLVPTDSRTRIRLSGPSTVYSQGTTRTSPRTNPGAGSPSIRGRIGISRAAWRSSSRVIAGGSTLTTSTSAGSGISLGLMGYELSPGRASERSRRTSGGLLESSVRVSGPRSCRETVSGTLEVRTRLRGMLTSVRRALTPRTEMFSLRWAARAYQSRNAATNATRNWIGYFGRRVTPAPPRTGASGTNAR